MTEKYLATSADQLGKIIEHRRNQLALSQHELREQSCVSASTISRLENGNVNTRLGSLFTLLHALDLELIISVKKISSKDEDPKGVW